MCGLILQLTTTKERISENIMTKTRCVSEGKATREKDVSDSGHGSLQVQFVTHETNTQVIRKKCHPAHARAAGSELSS